MGNEKNLYGKWIISKDRAPEAPCLYCDGHERNGVKLCRFGIIEGTFNGETLYFDAEVAPSPWTDEWESWRKSFAFPKNSMLAWMPLPERYNGEA